MSGKFGVGTVGSWKGRHGGVMKKVGILERGRKKKNRTKKISEGKMDQLKD